MKNVTLMTLQFNCSGFAVGGSSEENTAKPAGHTHTNREGQGGGASSLIGQPCCVISGLRYWPVFLLLIAAIFLCVTGLPHKADAKPETAAAGDTRVPSAEISNRLQQIN